MFTVPAMSVSIVMDPSRKRFRKEALVLSRLNHPNIATILDFDTQEGLKNDDRAAGGIVRTRR